MYIHSFDSSVLPFLRSSVRPFVRWSVVRSSVGLFVIRPFVCPSCIYFRSFQVCASNLPYADHFVHTHTSSSNLRERQLHSSLESATWGNPMFLTQLFKTVARADFKHVLRHWLKGPGCSIGLDYTFNLLLEIPVCSVIPPDSKRLWRDRHVNVI